jgi:phytoene dehydrogenase-like protein
MRCTSTINKVAVIGGGIGGMLTALTLARRGCEVTCSSTTTC